MMTTGFADGPVSWRAFLLKSLLWAACVFVAAAPFGGPAVAAASARVAAGGGGAVSVIAPPLGAAAARTFPVANSGAVRRVGRPGGVSSHRAGFILTNGLNTARVYHTATLLNNGMVLIAGGVGSGGFSDALASAELYSPETGTFTPTGSLGTARWSHTATLLNNGMVLIAGGAGSSGALLASAELYNPATGTFTPTGRMNTSRYEHTATLLNNGMVLIAGRLYTSSGNLSAELYNPETGSFAPTGNLNTARFSHTATLLNNGMVLIAGGVDVSAVVTLASTELYNPAAGTFTPTGSLNTPRFAHTATLLNTDAVLLAGGEGSSYSALASAELYNPETGAFTSTGGLNTARDNHTATLLNNGTALIVGGSNASALASAELYNPETGTFAPAGVLHTARVNHTATLLDTGVVLMAGGVGPAGFPGGTLASAELYEPGTLTPPLDLVFGTGYVAGGPGLAAPGTVDGNFSLISCPAGACGSRPFVTLTGQYPFPAWLPDTSSAQWIGPASGGNEDTIDAPGLYQYRETFDLTGFDLNTVVLSGSFATDNSGYIQLNGVTVGPTSSSSSSLTVFSLTTGFNQGINTLDFFVTNGPTGGPQNPTGLFVELTGTGAHVGEAPLQITTASLPNASSGAPYSTTLGATGGSGTGYTWSVLSGSLPAGYTLSSAGALTSTGSPAAPADSYSFTVKVADSTGNTATELLTLLVQMAQTTNIAIFGTGYVAGGPGLAAPGTVDGNFSLISCPAGACGSRPFVTLTGQYPFPSWLPDTSSAQWIGPASGGNEDTIDAPGLYQYQETFDLTGFDLSTVVLSGSFATDNSGYIQLNGVTVGPTSSSSSSLTVFSLTTGFNQGINTLDFFVTNGPTGGPQNPTGLFVELSGTGAPL
jgi:hypothetical protein